jgi:hypothetical protein
MRRRAAEQEPLRRAAAGALTVAAHAELRWKHGPRCAEELLQKSMGEVSTHERICEDSDSPQNRT